jgi:hypothetical protein
MRPYLLSCGTNLLRALRDPQNFFKHSHRKLENETISFKPDLTQFFIMDAVSLFYQVTKRIVPEMGVFSIWFSARNPYMMLPMVTDNSEFDEIVRKAQTINPADYDLMLAIIDTLLLHESQSQRSQ